MLAYLTDIEGRWDKLATFVEATPSLRFDDAGALRVEPGTTFVFGGDAIDRGPASRRIVRTLLDAKLRQPDRVVLIAGNRDLNKMRLVRELAGRAPEKCPPEVRSGPRSALLRWIFANTMGAKDAFEHRREELVAEGLDAGDEDVALSFLDDLDARGDLARYLAECQLAWRGGDTLVVHGAVTRENLGAVPGVAERLPTRDWVEALNGFIRREVAAWRASLGTAEALSDDYPGRAIVEYQAPVPDTRANQGSVVYGRPTDEVNHPWLPPREVVDALRRDGVARLLLGHTPSGDAPAALRDEGFTLVMADNSYGRVETGSRVAVAGPSLSVRGETQLDDGTRAEVAYDAGEGDGLLGQHDPSTGQLVKARLASGDYLLFRALPENKVEQVAASERDLRGRPLAPPYR